MAIDINADFTPSIPDSGVTPTKLPYNPTGSFKFWAQKVIPLVYDDSLSYYEVLCKVVTYLNNVIQNVDNLNDSVDNTNEGFETLQNYVNSTKDALISTYNELQDYVNTYFDNLDVQDEINAKLDAMSDSGELTTLLAPFIPDLVTAWLNSHVTPTSPIIDNTLSISGAGADAKVTGERIEQEVLDRQGSINDYQEGLEEYKYNLFMRVGYLDNSGAIDYTKKFRISSYKNIILDEALLVIIPSTIKLWLFHYNNGILDTITEHSNTTLTIPAQSEVRFEFGVTPVDTSIVYNYIEDLDRFDDLHVYKSSQYLSANKKEVNEVIPDHKPELNFGVGYLENDLSVNPTKRYRVTTLTPFTVSENYIMLKPSGLIVWVYVDGVQTDIRNSDGYMLVPGVQYIVSVSENPISTDHEYDTVHDLVGFDDIKVYKCADILQYYSTPDRDLKGSNLWRVGTIARNGNYETNGSRIYQPVPQKHKNGLLFMGEPGSFAWVIKHGTSVAEQRNQTDPWFLWYPYDDAVSLQFAEYPLDATIVYDDPYDNDIYDKISVYDPEEVKAICAAHPSTIHNNIVGIAHRGLANVFPENTGIAYESCAEIGNLVWETDIRATSDGVLVCLHDATINRTARNADGTEISGGDIAINSITYEEALTYDFGIWKGNNFAGTKILRFVDLIQLAKRHNATLVCDLSVLSIVPNIMLALSDAHFNNFFVTTMQDAIIDAVYMAMPSARVMKIYGQSTTTSAIDSLLETYPNLYGVSMFLNIATAELVNHIKNKGIISQIYNISKMATLKTWIQNGVDQICSNDLQIQAALDVFDMTR